MYNKITTVKGAAGTGKTTQIKKYLTQDKEILVCAPTNKAASVLRNKDIPAKTIHSGIYIAEIDEDEPPTECYKPVIDMETGKPKVDDTGKVIYDITLKYKYHYTINKKHINKTLIIDEASMVSSKIWSDIFNVWLADIIAVGDPNQLSPVEDKESIVKATKDFFHNAKPTMLLTKNYRSGDEIIKLSEHILQSNKKHCIPYGIFNENVITFDPDKNPDSKYEVLVASFYACDIAICFTHITKSWLNAKLRPIKLGVATHELDDLPMKGDRLITENNNADYNIYKNEFLTVLDTMAYDEQNSVLWANVNKEGENTSQWIPLNVGAMTGNTRVTGIQQSAVKVNWGYAITCHSAQGSEWDNVFIWDELQYYQSKQWEYTAVTRAKHQVIAYRGANLFENADFIYNLNLTINSEENNE
jgi:exodeoxyribonuclease V